MSTTEKWKTMTLETLANVIPSPAPSVRSKGLNPAITRPMQAIVRLTSSTDSRPCSDQYTSDMCRIRANSSRTSDVPTPTITAAISSHGRADVPTAMNAPMISRIVPGTAWWMWVPDAETLSLNGPRPAWISRVIVRVTKNVTTKELKHSSSGTRCRSVISRWYQSCTARSYGTSPTEMPTFVSRR